MALTIFFFPPSSAGERASPRLLRWLCGTSWTPWRSTSPTRPLRPGLPAPPPPTSRSTAPRAPAAAPWPSPGEGELEISKLSSFWRGSPHEELFVFLLFSVTVFFSTDITLVFVYELTFTVSSLKRVVWILGKLSASRVDDFLSYACAVLFFLIWVRPHCVIDNCHLSG